MDEIIGGQGLITTRQETLALELAPIDQVCGALYSCGVTMVAGRSGLGKSLFALHMAAYIAAGKDMGGWHTPKARRVLYVDGEMATQYMQQRLIDVPESGENLNLIHLESMRKADCFINMSKQMWRDYFLRPQIFESYDVFIFDTVSSLLLTDGEVGPFEPEYWLQLESMHQQFRAHGKTVVWIDNLNKAGEIFGTAVKQHKVDSLWTFEEWKNCPYEATARFGMFQGKYRGDDIEADGNWYFKKGKGWKLS